MASPDKPRRLSMEEGYRRFAHEFTLIKTLGRGTFGSVVKVRHHLDNRTYALKMIPCTSSLHSSSTRAKEKTLREVSVLSGLSHRNVVRYYAAWIEDTDPSFFRHSNDDEYDDDDDPGQQTSESGTATSMNSLASTSRSGIENQCLFIQVDPEAQSLAFHNCARAVSELSRRWSCACRHSRSISPRGNLLTRGGSWCGPAMSYSDNGSYL
jgi:serine/threonine protein kinase